MRLLLGLSWPSPSPASLPVRRFAKFHSTVRGLQAAAADGALPPLADGSPRPFDANALRHHYATACDFDHFLTPHVSQPTIDALIELRAIG